MRGDWGNRDRNADMPMYFQCRVPGYGYIVFLQLLARKAMDPHSWAVPSTLHQKIKFVTEGQLVSIAAEEDMIVATSSGAPYVEANEKAMECFFKSLEFVNAMYVGEGAKVPMPKLSENTHSGLRQVPSKGARAGKGLGKRL